MNALPLHDPGLGWCSHCGTRRAASEIDGRDLCWPCGPVAHGGRPVPAIAPIEWCSDDKLAERAEAIGMPLAEAKRRWDAAHRPKAQHVTDRRSPYAIRAERDLNDFAPLDVQALLGVARSSRDPVEKARRRVAILKAIDGGAKTRAKIAAQIGERQGCIRRDLLMLADTLVISARVRNRFSRYTITDLGIEVLERLKHG